jgi:hypothetical protein
MGKRRMRRPRKASRDRSFDLAAALSQLAGQSEPAKPALPASSAKSVRFEIHMDPGETEDGMRAKTALRPTVRAAQTLASFDESWGETNDLTALVGKLADQVQAVQRGELGRAEEMLIAQAHTLDMLFHKLVHRSMANSKGGYLDASEIYMRLALRTQSQCRATLETLSVVKNPPSVAFVRQANIANGAPLQVNNGTAPAEPPRAREIPQPQLLEQHPHERLDTGTTQATSGRDPTMAPVGKVNGAAHRSR